LEFAFLAFFSHWQQVKGNIKKRDRKKGSLKFLLKEEDAKAVRVLTSKKSISFAFLVKTIPFNKKVCRNEIVAGMFPKSGGAS
jgi:hypothetical protein